MTTIPELLAAIRADSPHALEVLTHQWECRDPRLWQQSEELYLECGKKAIALGQPIMAFDILQEGRSYFPGHVHLTYFAALALARSGSTGHAFHAAQQLLASLDRAHPLYPQVLSLAGRIAKDRWAKSPEGERKQMLGVMAADWYRQAYECSGGDYFPGINAATMSILSGQVEAGQRIARQVRETCRTLQATAQDSDYWLPATIGEACLLLDEQEEAIQGYRAAARLAGNNVGDMASIRRQVQLLATYLDVDTAILDVLRAGRGIVFSGHMIDAPNRPTPRFPPELEPAVRAAITATLNRLDVSFGYASAACGADIVLLECLLERNAHMHIILPFRQEDFLQMSVAFAGPLWVERFHRVLEAAATVRYATQEGYLGDDILFDYNIELIHGTALLHANHLGAELVGLFVLDAASVGRVGGTHDAIAAWQRTGNHVEIIALNQLRSHPRKSTRRRAAVAPVAPPAPPAPPQTTIRIAREIKTMLFADMVGFSLLADESAPSFIVHFLGEVAKVIAAGQVQPTFKNTWGDGLFMVFDDIVVGADFALRLRDAMQYINWAAVGLPADTNIRMGLHAGPVFPGQDLIIAQRNFFGSHVNMAARIEPVTPPGAVYVSEQFASLLVARGMTDFACDYMGHIALAKRFGVYPIYRLRRSHEVE